MTVSIISNQAATSASRALESATENSRIAINKVSSGQRVFSAEEDAAALAIGAGLRMTSSGLRTASLNARAGVSMLQVADGAMSQLGDALTRMQALAVQASSGQYSDSVRATIDAEFQQIRSEIERIVQDTEFNGTKLLAGGPQFTEITASSLANYGVSLTEFDGNLITTDSSHRFEYDATTETMTLYRSEGGTEVSQSVDLTLALDDVAGAGDNLRFDENIYVNFNTVGLTIQLNNSFDRSTSFGVGGVAVTTAGSVTHTAISRASDINITDEAVTAVGALASLNTTTGRIPVTLTTDATEVQVDGIAGVRYAMHQITEAATTATDGMTISAMDPTVVTADGSYRYSYDATTEVLTLQKIDGGVVSTETVDVTSLIDGVVTTAGNNLSGSQTVEVAFNTLGVTLTLDNSFVRGANLGAGVITESIAGDVTVGNEAISFATANITDEAVTALNALGAPAVDLVNGTIDLTLTTDGTDVQVGAIAGLKFELNGGGVGAAGAATGNLTLGGPANTVGIYIDDGVGDVLIATVNLTNVATTGATDRVIETDFTKGMFAQNFATPGTVGADGTATGDLIRGARTTNLVGMYVNDGTSNVRIATLELANVATSGVVSRVLDVELGTSLFAQTYDPDDGPAKFTYMIGTGNNRDEDLLTVSLSGLHEEALGINLLNVTTQANADSSISTLASALTVLNTARSTLGAAQSRLEFAASNITIALENNEIARSTLLDADTAAEITEVTRQQLLLEAATSMLAQANSQPQVLLRLLQ